MKQLNLAAARLAIQRSRIMLRAATEARDKDAEITSAIKAAIDRSWSLLAPPPNGQAKPTPPSGNGADAPDTRLIARNVMLESGRTSMKLDQEHWLAVKEICRRERITIAVLVQRATRDHRGCGRTSAVRVFILNYFRDLATEEGHRKAGHGSLD